MAPKYPAVTIAEILDAITVAAMPATAAETAALPAVAVVIAGDDQTDTHLLQMASNGEIIASACWSTTARGDGKTTANWWTPTDRNSTAILFPVLLQLSNPSQNADRWGSIAASGAGLGVAKVARQGEAITLLASAARTAGATATAVTGLGWHQRWLIVLDITASATDASDTLDVFIDVSWDGGTTWCNAIHYAQQAGNGAARRDIATLEGAAATAPIDVTADAAAGAIRPVVAFDAIRVRYAIVDSGDANQSHTFSVKAYAI